MARYQKRKRKKVDRDPRLVKSINKKRKHRGAWRSSWWNETSSTVDQVMSLNKVLSPRPPHLKSLKKGIRDLHFSVSKFVSNFETVSNVKILVVNSLNILGHGPVTVKCFVCGTIFRCLFTSLSYFNHDAKRRHFSIATVSSC